MNCRVCDVSQQSHPLLICRNLSVPKLQKSPKFSRGKETVSHPSGVPAIEVGGNARKTNKDYTGGTLPQLVDIIIEEKAMAPAIVAPK